MNWKKLTLSVYTLTMHLIVQMDSNRLLYSTASVLTHFSKEQQNKKMYTSVLCHKPARNISNGPKTKMFHHRTNLSLVVNLGNYMIIQKKQN